MFVTPTRKPDTAMSAKKKSDPSEKKSKSHRHYYFLGKFSNNRQTLEQIPRVEFAINEAHIVPMQTSCIKMGTSSIYDLYMG